jgi:predicted aldo/keto reductase-like oxidoreductase
MSHLKHVKENINSADNSGINCLSEKELAIIKELKTVFSNRISVPCTYCKYCMPCPSGVAIPVNFDLLNLVSWNGMNPYAKTAYTWMASTPEEAAKQPDNGNASLCAECGECLDKCPQHINIPEELKRVVMVFEKGISLDNTYKKQD